MSGSSESSDSPRVAVIGAGAAGLVAARYFRDAGFEVVVWEMAEEVGGTWLFSEAVTEGRGNLYRSLSTNLPKEIMQFSDLPFEGDLPSFVQHTEVARYLRRYADVFDLRPLIRFNTKVLRVERLPPPPPLDSTSSLSPCLATRPGRLWEVTHQRHRPAQVSSSSSSQAENGKPVHDVDGSGRVRDGNGHESSPQVGDRSIGEESAATSQFDIVLVCNGHFSKAYAPAFEGLDTFPGAVMHSKRYREPTPFVGKTVVMVGAGASGVDITREVSGVARKVYACVRGQPSPPPSLRSGCAAKTAVADVFGHSPALKLKLGCEIVRATRDGYIEFSDGSRTESPVDALVFCTGYYYHLPFLAPSSRVFFHPDRARRALSEAGSNSNGDGDGDIGAEEGEGKSVWPLYEHVLHVEQPSLAFIGLNWKVLPFACFEVQTRFALALMRHPHFLAWDADPDLDSHIDDPKYAREHASSHLRARSHYSGTSSTTDVRGNDDGDDDGGLEEGREEDKRFPSTKRTLAERLWAEWDAGSIAEAAGGADSARRERQQRVKDYHMLGSHQWAYYRHLHRLSRQATAAAARCRRGQQDEAGTGGQQRRGRRVREVYEDVGRARLQDPDTYRRRQYTFSPSDEVAWRVHVPPPPSSSL
ncbi:Flavinbinding monooxygenase-like subfamily protein [Acanthamoeba castellanii str. Neff]|uniref:Flavinbinding monooxygenase-like subfamily protein n=1 Tax=Acanthamoeba castellanii (strain ATCC 30010 / Neff) TaxID=1257118 RepID=L8GWK2_ACACF|nr:Flavinbinding monooxygenase-like subfamily protein [Acanthamoeba castellanii str. Neff]ELR17322.1 Flavinbinding monooxygenase-like subfamily protein [Acanthamoeba castellanii str. Neff]